MSRGVAAAGAYVPRFRLSTDAIREAWGTADASGIESKAVPAADEDALTMAVAAAERALDGAPVGRGGIETVGIATTTPPLEEGMLAPRLVRALGLPDDAAVSEHTQSTAAGAEALERALSADGPALAVAADCPEGAPADADHSTGAGAAAFLVADDPEVTVVDSAWHTDEYPGVRFRSRGDRSVDSLGATSYERDAIRECVAGAIRGLDADGSEVRAAALHQPDGRMPHRIDGEASLGSEAVGRGTVVGRIGDAGAAAVPLGILAALESAGEDGLTVAGFFGGGAGGAAVAFEGGLDAGVGAAIEEGVDLSYPEYLRQRGYVVSGGVDGGGAHVSVPTWRGTLDARYRLVAGRCPDCGALAFPPEGACPDCHARSEFEPVEMPRSGTVAAVTTIGQGGAPPEFAEHQQRAGPYAVAIVELRSDDGSVTLPGQIADADPGSVEVGDGVRAAFRRIYEQEGVTRYGAKFVPR